jgi:hypothetical protein
LVCSTHLLSLPRLARAFEATFLGIGLENVGELDDGEEMTQVKKREVGEENKSGN